MHSSNENLQVGKVAPTTQDALWSGLLWMSFWVGWAVFTVSVFVQSILRATGRGETLAWSIAASAILTPLFTMWFYFFAFMLVFYPALAIADRRTSALAKFAYSLTGPAIGFMLGADLNGYWTALTTGYWRYPVRVTVLSIALVWAIGILQHHKKTLAE